MGPDLLGLFFLGKDGPHAVLDPACGQRKYKYHEQREHTIDCPRRCHYCYQNILVYLLLLWSVMLLLLVVVAVVVVPVFQRVSC